MQFSLLNKCKILGPDYIRKLDDDLATQEVRKFILRIKNNKATECDCIPA